LSRGRIPLEYRNFQRNFDNIKIIKIKKDPIEDIIIKVRHNQNYPNFVLLISGVVKGKDSP